MVDPATGTFRIRSTGRPRAGSKLRRSVIASFRRKSFLDFLYFTDFETTDPINYAAAYQSWANTNCGSGRYRPQRATTGGPGNDGCIEIQFADADAITGPFHTNDSILTCGTPDFGRLGQGGLDRVHPDRESVDHSSGARCPAGPPNFRTTPRTGVTKLTMPTTNATLEALAAADGKLYTGKTSIRFNAATNNMTVTNPTLGTNETAVTADQRRDLREVGRRRLRDDPAAVRRGLLRVGLVRDRLRERHVHQEHDAGRGQRHHRQAVRRAATPTATSSASGDAVLGLIATNFVRVYHPCSGYHDAERPHRRRDPLAAALLHRRQLRLRQPSSETSPSRARSPRSTAVPSAPAAPHPAARATSRTTSTTTGCSTAARRTSSIRSPPAGT